MNEVGKDLEEGVVAQSSHYLSIRLVGLRKTRTNLVIKVGVSDEIRTECLLDSSLELYRYEDPLSVSRVTSGDTVPTKRLSVQICNKDIS
jgi:hypothetical protein